MQTSHFESFVLVFWVLLLLTTARPVGSLGRSGNSTYPARQESERERNRKLKMVAKKMRRLDCELFVFVVSRHCHRHRRVFVISH